MSAILKVLKKARSIKSAGPIDQQIQQLEQSNAADMRSQAISTAVRLGLLSTGVGIAGRGLQGMFKQLQRNTEKKRKAIPAYNTFEIPVEAKLANAPEQPGMFETATKGVSDFMNGSGAQTPTGIPWALPLWTAAIGGGFLGGRKLTDYVMDKRRKKHLDQDLEAARQEYYDAMFNKQSELCQELDGLFDDLEKQASSAGEIGGAALGTYGTIALLSALAGGASGYNDGVSRQNKTLVDKAVKLRRRMLAERQPTPLMAIPVTQDAPPAQEEETVSPSSIGAQQLKFSHPLWV